MKSLPFLRTFTATRGASSVLTLNRISRFIYSTILPAADLGSFKSIIMNKGASTCNSE